MEFWGAEIKPGKPLKVKPEENCLIHISQATLDCKGKMGEPVLLYVTVDDTKLVIGTLSQEKFPQISFDLVFEKNFELSHNCTKGNVHFIGYISPNIEQYPFSQFCVCLSFCLVIIFILGPKDTRSYQLLLSLTLVGCVPTEEDDYSDSEEEEEEEEAQVPATVTANGNSGAAAANVVKADSKPKAKPAEVKPESDEDGSDSEEDDSSDDEDDDSDSEKGMDVDEGDSDDSEDEEEEEEEEEEETPKKPEPVNKKRANESASKAPVSGKKAKPAAAPAATPQKTEEKKKGGHVATPHPKKGGKSPVNANQSPKKGGQSSDGSNKKQFNSGKQFGSNKGKGKGRA